MEQLTLKDHPKPFDIEALLLEMYPDLSDTNDTGVFHMIAREEGLVLYNKLKELGKIKE